MYHSLACWKTAAIVDRELKNLTSKTAKVYALKENIRMRVLGLGWNDLAITWSKSGVQLSVSELTYHLKAIIVHQKKRRIPEKPPVIIPERESLPPLGLPVKELKQIDLASHANLEYFEQNARSLRNTREAVGMWG